MKPLAIIAILIAAIYLLARYNRPAAVAAAPVDIHNLAAIPAQHAATINLNSALNSALIS